MIETRALTVLCA